MRTKKHTFVNLDGIDTVTERPWTKKDYMAAIKDLENSVTDRRVREAMIGKKEAIDFISDVESQISVLREEMDTIDK